MSKARWFTVSGIALLGLAAIIAYAMWPGTDSRFIDPSADTARVMLGKTVYTNHCAACHGVNLEGQANWRERMANGRLPAPPHDKTGHTWHHPDAMLIDMIKNGLVP